MGRKAQHAPQRTCIACRREGDQGLFLRFVLSPGGEIIPDIAERLPGRGAYTCISRRCLLDAVKRRQFGRAFKGTATGGEELDSLIVAQMERRVGGYLSLANKAGAVVSGGEAVERSLRGTPQPGLLLLAADISAAIGEKLSGLAGRCGVPVERVLDKELLGQLLGKESDRSAVAIMSPGFSRSLGSELERYRNYLEEESGR